MRYFYMSQFADFKLAQKTYLRSTTTRRVQFHLAMWGILVIGILLALVMEFMPTHNSILQIALPILAGGLGGAGLITPLLRPLALRRTYKASNGDPKEPKRIYLGFEDGFLLSGIEGKSEGRFQRAGICNVAEDDKMMLLFITQKKFLYIPKEQLPGEAIEELRAWLSLPGAPEKC